MGSTLTKKQANWYYAMFFNGALRCPHGLPAGFVYDYVDGRTDERLSAFLANTQRLARGGGAEQASKLLDTVFGTYS